MEWHAAIKQALTVAKAAHDNGNREAAASAYDKAAHFMTLYAEQASTREIEANRKRQAVEYRKIARTLRGGDAATAPGGAARRGVPGPTVGSAAASTLLSGSVSSSAASSTGSSANGNGARAATLPAEPSDSDRGDDDEISLAVKRLIQTANITWTDIGGLEETKNEIKYALALSVATPPDGVAVSGFRNLLLYGPPGTGKTLLAAATSNAFRPPGAGPEAGPGAVFFNVKVSSVMSKYFGESTKIVSELYGQARDTCPAVVFLDEFEALAISRDTDNTGPERRILSTILSELDGLSEKGRRDIYVLTIAATNRPWDMDPAVLSRFEKPIYIPLPDAAAREAMLRIMLDRRGHRINGPREALVEITNGLSGREIERLCKEVISRMITALNADLPRLVDAGMEAVRRYQVRVRPLEVTEFEAARKTIVPVTGPAEVARYERWRAGLEN